MCSRTNTTAEPIGSRPHHFSRAAVHKLHNCMPSVSERDAIVRRETLASGKSFTVLSWNVNGIRATAKKGLETLRGVVKEERPDLVCFQVRAARRHESNHSGAK